jgi:predicted negative regulator of RcsB-dependent stress response
MKTLKVILIFTIVFILMIAFAKWSDQRDQKIAAASDKYEACIKKEYGMSPAAYYNDQGKYPECVTTNK